MISYDTLFFVFYITVIRGKEYMSICCYFAVSIQWKQNSFENIYGPSSCISSDKLTVPSETTTFAR